MMEPDTLDLLRRVLGDSRAQVAAAPSVEAALATLEGFEPHVLISDVSMPGRGDGYELIRGGAHENELRAAPGGGTHGIHAPGRCRSGARRGVSGAPGETRRAGATGEDGRTSRRSPGRTG